MSQYIHNQDNKEFLCGYDEPLGHVFMVVSNIQTGDLLYSNLFEDNALEIKEFCFFEKIALEKFNTKIPNDIIENIANDKTKAGK